MASFSQQIKKHNKKYKAEMLLVVQRVCLDLFGQVVMKTPVDKGRARGNWMVGINRTPQESMTEIDNNPFSRIVVDILGAKFGDTIALTNSVAYIGVLEYGGFPNPPLRGTWVKGTGKIDKRFKAKTYAKGGQGHFEIRSEGGFSKQAPQGMVRTTVAAYQTTLDTAVNLVKGGS